MPFELPIQLPETTADLLARLGLAVLAFILIWLLRGLLIFVARKLLRRLAITSKLPLDVTIRDLIGLPVQVLMLALAIHVSAVILDPDPEFMILIFRLTRSLVVIAAVILLYRVISILVSTRARLQSFTRVEIQDPLVPFVRTGLHLLLLALAVIILIDTWGYDVTGLVAGLGLGGLAISLAAQDTVSNIFGFSMIVGDRPFVVGEFIKTPDVEGIVERVGLRSTRVRQLNQALVTVPNSKVAGAAVLNWSRLEKRWIDFIIRINYGATPDQIEELMARIRAELRGREAVDSDSVVVHFITFGENALEILVRAYVMKPNWLDFTQEREKINLAVMRVVADLGLSFAYPTRSIRIDKFPPLHEELHEGVRSFGHEMGTNDSGNGI